MRQRTNASDPTDPTTARTYNIVQQIFSRNLAGGDKAVILFNRAEAPQVIEVSWSELHLRSRGTYHVRDVWAHGEHGADVGVFTKGYRAVVQPHEAMTLRISSVTDAT